MIARRSGRGEAWALRLQPRSTCRTRGLAGRAASRAGAGPLWAMVP